MKRKSSAPGSKKAKKPVTMPENIVQPAEKTEHTPKQAGAAVPAAIPAEPALDRNETVKVVLFSLLTFFSMIVPTGWMVILLLWFAFALALPIGKDARENYRRHFGVVTVSFVCLAVINLVNAIRPIFELEALAVYYRYIAAFCIAAVMFVRFGKKHVRALLWGLLAAIAAVAVLCVDASTNGLLFRGVNAVTAFLGNDMSAIALDNLGRNRVTGLYNNPNITGSMFGLGCFIAMYFVGTERERKKKFIAFFLLGICAQSCFLSTSRGAILCFGASLLVWLAIAGKGNRIPLFFLMAASAACTIALSFLAIQCISSQNELVTLLVLVTGPVIYLLDQIVGLKVIDVLSRHVRVAACVIALLVVGAAAYVVVGVQLTGPHTFTENGSLFREVKLTPGTYTVSGDWDDGVSCTVLVEGPEDLLMERYETVYYGSLPEGSVVTIPEDAASVHISLSGPEGAQIRSMEFSDGSVGTTVKLDYLLLPSSVADRLQDSLFTSSSFLLRVQYMKDAWKLFMMQPILGHGLGSTEALYTVVQPVFYESLYVHNHILQIMSDTGLVGLAAFLAFIGGSLWLLLRQLRKERDPLAVMLMVCWVMMNLHGLMEINFSIRAYETIAFQLLLLPVLAYAKPLGKEQTVQVGSWVLCGVLCVYLGTAAYLVSQHQLVQDESQRYETTSITAFLEKLKSNVKRDVFINSWSKRTFIAYEIKYNEAEYVDDMLKYVEDLRKGGYYTDCASLAVNYYLVRGQIEELFECSRQGIYQEAANPEAWNLQFQTYREDILAGLPEAKIEAYLDGVLGTCDYLAEYNVGRMEQIELTEENQEFVELVKSIRSQGLSGAEAYNDLMVRYHPDVLAQKLQETTEEAD